MDLLSAPRISTVSYVLNFKSPDFRVRFKQSEIEAKFAGFVTGQSQQTNVPDNGDPSQPRIIFSSGPKAISVSQLNCQLQLSFENLGKSLPQQLDIARHNVVAFADRARDVFADDEIASRGVVYEILFPSTAKIGALQEYFYKKYFSRTPLGKIASAQMAVGFQFGELFINIAAGVYENYKVDTSGFEPGGLRYVPISAAPVVEHGIGVKIDINDRPRNKPAGAIDAAKELLVAGEDFFANHFTNFTDLSLNND